MTILVEVILNEKDGRDQKLHDSNYGHHLRVIFMVNKTGRPLGVKTSAGFAISDFTLVSPGLEFQFNKLGCDRRFASILVE